MDKNLFKTVIAPIIAGLLLIAIAILFVIRCNIAHEEEKSVKPRTQKSVDYTETQTSKNEENEDHVKTQDHKEINNILDIFCNHGFDLEINKLDLEKVKKNELNEPLPLKIFFKNEDVDNASNLQSVKKSLEQYLERYPKLQNIIQFDPKKNDHILINLKNIDAKYENTYKEFISNLQKMNERNIPKDQIHVDDKNGNQYYISKNYSTELVTTGKTTYCVFRTNEERILAPKSECVEVDGKFHKKFKFQDDYSVKDHFINFVSQLVNIIDNERSIKLDFDNTKRCTSCQKVCKLLLTMHKSYESPLSNLLVF